MSKADEASIVAGQPSDLKRDRVGGDRRGGGHPHQSDDCRAPGTTSDESRRGSQSVFQT